MMMWTALDITLISVLLSIMFLLYYEPDGDSLWLDATGSWL